MKITPAGFEVRLTQLVRRAHSPMTRTNAHNCVVATTIRASSSGASPVPSRPAVENPPPADLLSVLFVSLLKMSCKWNHRAFEFGFLHLHKASRWSVSARDSSPAPPRRPAVFRGSQAPPLVYPRAS